MNILVTGPLKTCQWSKNLFPRVRRSVESPLRADEIASELIDQGYITTLKRLGYRDAPKNVAFLKLMALEESGVTTSLPSSVAKHARNIFSAASDVPDSTMEKIKTG